MGNSEAEGEIMNLQRVISNYTILPVHRRLSIKPAILEVLITDFSDQLEAAFETLEEESVSEVSIELPEDEGIVTVLLIDGKVDIQFEENSPLLFTTLFQSALEDAFDDLVKDQHIEEALDRKFGKHRLSTASINEIDAMLKHLT